MIRVVLVDDQALFRAGIRMLVASQPDLEVVGEAGDGKEALDVVRKHPMAALRVFAYVAAGAGLVQFWFVSIPSYAHLKVGAAVKDGALATTICLAVFVLLQVPMGRLSDAIGRKPMLLFFAIAIGSALTPRKAASAQTRDDAAPHDTVAT